MRSSINIFVLPALAVLSAVSCDKSQFQDPFDQWIEGGRIFITASSGEPQGRTVLQADGTVCWSPADSVSVFYGPYGLGKFTGLNADTSRVTVFRSDATFAFGSISGGSPCRFFGVNPYNSSNASDGSSLTIEVPAEQRAVPGTFAPGSFPSIAQSDNLELAFYNVCGGLKFKVTGSGITRVSFRGNGGELLAGRVKAGFGEDGLPEVREHIDSVTSVSVVCEEGLVPGQWYFISMLPAELPKGFTIDLDNGVKTLSYVSGRSTSIKRAVFGVISDLDEGLSLEQDWKQCDFVHKSLMLAVPNCAFSSVFVSNENTQISNARKQTAGNIEVIQLFANGPSPTEGISSLVSLMNITSVPFEITDYRQKTSGSVTPYSTYVSTPQLYGTASGIALKSYYNGDELTVEASIYIKSADGYKIVAALVQDDAGYAISLNAGANVGTMESQGVTRYLLTDITGDPLNAVSDGVILYRSYRKVISDPGYRDNLRVLVYVLRPYGSRTVTSNGSFGSYYVDNALSALAGTEVQLPGVKKINSEIASFNYGGTISF